MTVVFLELALTLFILSMEAQCGMEHPISHRKLIKEEMLDDGENFKPTIKLVASPTGVIGEYPKLAYDH